VTKQLWHSFFDVRYDHISVEKDHKQKTFAKIKKHPFKYSKKTQLNISKYQNDFSVFL